MGKKGKIVSSNLSAEAAKIKKQAAKLEKNSFAAQDKFDYQTGIKGSNLHGAEMPAKYFYRDPYDETAKVKQALASTMRPAPITEADVEAVKNKLREKNVYDFDRFFAQQYSTATANLPAELRYAQQLNPEFFNRREREIDNQAELHKRLAKLRLFGARSLEDVELQKLIAENKLKLPKAALWRLDTEANRVQDAFKRGLWNPLRKKDFVAANTSGLGGDFTSRGDPVVGAIGAGTADYDYLIDKHN